MFYTNTHKEEDGMEIFPKRLYFYGDKAEVKVK